MRMVKRSTDQEHVSLYKIRVEVQKFLMQNDVKCVPLLLVVGLDEWLITYMNHDDATSRESYFLKACTFNTHFRVRPTLIAQESSSGVLCHPYGLDDRKA